MSAPTIRRYPRTLEQAFGPYARGPIVEPAQRMPLGHRVVTWLSSILAVVLVGAVALGAV
jgi:hypothetical protein